MVLAEMLNIGVIGSMIGGAVGGSNGLERRTAEKIAEELSGRNKNPRTALVWDGGMPVDKDNVGAQYLRDQQPEYREVKTEMVNTSMLHVEQNFGRSDGVERLDYFENSTFQNKIEVQILKAGSEPVIPSNHKIIIRLMGVNGTGRVEHGPIGVGSEVDSLERRKEDLVGIVVDETTDKAYVVFAYNKDTGAMTAIRDLDLTIKQRSWAVIPLSTKDGSSFTWNNGTPMFRIDSDGVMIWKINGKEIACIPSGGKPMARPISVSPTAQPTNEAIYIPTAAPPESNKVLNSILESFKYTTEDLVGINVTSANVQIGGETVKALVGKDKTGVSHILAVEMDGKMVRMGESVDEKGNKTYAFVNPEYDPLNRILTNEKTAGMISDAMLTALAQGQFKNETGGDLTKMKALLAKNGGKLDLKIPVADPAAGDWQVKWIEPGVKADFTKPIEIQTIFTKAGVDAFMKSELGGKLMRFRNDEQISGNLLNIGPDGHMQFIFIENSQIASESLNYVPKSNVEISTIKKVLSERVGWNILEITEIFKSINRLDAFKNIYLSSTARFDAKSRGMFEFSVDIKP